MAAQLQKRNKLAEEQEEIEEMQHGPFTIEQRQETYKRKNNQLPLLWAIMTILIPGFIKFWTILSTPSYHWAIFVAFLLGTAFYVQLDISGIFRNGALFGILSLPVKFLSILMNLLKKRRPVAPDTRRNLHVVDHLQLFELSIWC